MKMTTKLFKILNYVFFVAFVHFSLSAQISEKIPLSKDHQLLGLGRQYILKSGILEEERPIIISLPLGYENNDANYPVLYLLDGLGNIKHEIGTVELLTDSGIIPPMIIVGIESLDRSRDLTPSRAGQGVMEKPDIFDAFIIQAPALWWNKEEMTAEAKQFFKSNSNLDKTIYFGIGGGDGWGMRQELKRYVQVIEENPPKKLRWKHEEVGDEDHDTSRLLLNYYGIKYVFSDLVASEELRNNYSDEAFLKAESELMDKYGPQARRPVSNYVDIALKLLEKENHLGAIVVFERAVKAYPKYIGLMTNLAKLY